MNQSNLGPMQFLNCVSISPLFLNCALNLFCFMVNWTKCTFSCYYGANLPSSSFFRIKSPAYV